MRRTGNASSHCVLPRRCCPRAEANHRSGPRIRAPHQHEPSLKITARGSLLLDFGNDQGRDRWHQRITIAFRNKDLVVAGDTYESRDALVPDKGQSCDLNLLTGTGTRNLKPVTFTPGGVPMARWSEDTTPPLCKFAD